MSNNRIMQRLKGIITVFFICFVFSDLLGNLCHAQELSIGVPLVEEPINLAQSDQLFARLVHSATTQPLISLHQNETNRIKLVLADSYSSSFDGTAAEMRLKNGASFVSSKLVEQIDLNVSLNKCSAASGFPVTFKTYLKSGRIYISVMSPQGQAQLLEFLASCPIYEERTLVLFGADLGNANLVLGTGPYNLVSRIKNREARLERIGKTSAWASVITIRGFESSVNALSALRGGTIDAFYSEDQEIKLKVANDPTLRMLTCGVYNIILRKGLEINCSSSTNLDLVRYSVT